MTTNPYSPVDTQPVKRFFVEMLTRDIAIEDAILDLLDNCVDGIIRSQSTAEGANKNDKPGNHPYEGFWANIIVSGEKFEIKDNCGGIPWSSHERAFRMGRPTPRPGEDAEDAGLSVGVYGIGMKRAIFKLGREAEILTQNRADRYSIPISEDWMTTENNWILPVVPVADKSDYDGTQITVTKLAEGVSDVLGSDAFIGRLLKKIEAQYALIITKGLDVKVNGTSAKPYPIELRFAPGNAGATEIRPYMFRSDSEGVEVFLAVGLREPIPDAETELEGQREIRYSSDQAGWTVICNDRIVLYCNRDELTGWGTAGLPRYHTQFIAISGVVEFRGDPRLLPTTTTKRGLDFSSPLYQQVLNKMRDGLRMFVNFTNQWKTREEDAKAYVLPVPAVSYIELKRETDDVKFNPVRTGLEGEQYRPKLPVPPNNATDQRIAYFREKTEIRELADTLLPDVENIREKDLWRRVGEASFDFTYEHLVGNTTD